MISNLVSARHSFGRFRPLKPAVNVETAFKVLRTGSTTFLALVPLPANRSASRLSILAAPLCFRALPYGPPARSATKCAGLRITWPLDHLSVYLMTQSTNLLPHSIEIARPLVLSLRRLRSPPCARILAPVSCSSAPCDHHSLRRILESFAHKICHKTRMAWRLLATEHKVVI